VDFSLQATENPTPQAEAHANKALNRSYRFQKYLPD
jgi:hypothetical protein